MGDVYLGHDLLLDRPVAIKFINAVEPDSMLREQFLTEARAAARLQHPNVVTVYRVGEIDGHPYIISEYIRGQALDRAKRPMPWQRVRELALGLARGLAAAHRRGVLHRDIKPGNVIIPSEGEVKLLDFGLAKFVDASGSQETSPAVRTEPKEEPAQPEPLAAMLDVGVVGPVGIQMAVIEPRPQPEETITPRELPKSLFSDAPSSRTDDGGLVHISYRQLLRETPRPESRPTAQATNVAAAFAANTITDGLLSGRMEPADRSFGETSTIKGTDQQNFSARR
jgi:serine/threonine protein kinase